MHLETQKYFSREFLLLFIKSLKKNNNSTEIIYNFGRHCDKIFIIHYANAVQPFKITTCFNHIKNETTKHYKVKTLGCSIRKQNPLHFTLLLDLAKTKYQCYSSYIGRSRQNFKTRIYYHRYALLIPTDTDRHPVEGEVLFTHLNCVENPGKFRSHNVAVWLEGHFQTVQFKVQSYNVLLWVFSPMVQDR